MYSLAYLNEKKIFKLFLHEKIFMKKITSFMQVFYQLWTIFYAANLGLQHYAIFLQIRLHLLCDVIVDVNINQISVLFLWDFVANCARLKYVGIWKCYQQLHIRQICEEVYPVHLLHWDDNIFVTLFLIFFKNWYFIFLSPLLTEYLMGQLK